LLISVEPIACHFVPVVAKGKAVRVMAMKTIIKRWAPGGKEAELLPFLIELRFLAMAHPGYICGETLKKIDDPEAFVVI
jgi:hypothetical protein